MLHRRHVSFFHLGVKKKVFGADSKAVDTYLRVTFLLLNEFRLCSEQINHSGSQHMAMQRSDGTHLREHHGFT